MERIICDTVIDLGMLAWILCKSYEVSCTCCNILIHLVQCQVPCCRSFSYCLYPGHIFKMRLASLETDVNCGLEIFQMACHSPRLHLFLHGKSLSGCGELPRRLIAKRSRFERFFFLWYILPTMSSPCFIRCRKRDRKRNRSVDVSSDVQHSDHS